MGAPSPDPNAEYTDLQREKLRLEIRELNRPWWQRHISAFLPAALGILTVTVAYTTGYFSVLSEKLAVQRQVLERDVKEFSRQKDEIASQIRGLNTERDRISAENNRLKQQTKAISEQNENLARTKKQLETRLALASLNSDISRLRELPSKVHDVRAIQQSINQAIRGPDPEVQAVAGRIAKALNAEDGFQKNRL